MEADKETDLLLQMLPDIAVQLRGALSNVHLAAAALAPAEAREADPALDAKAALLDQAYYQMLRLVDNLSAASALRGEGGLPLQDGDLVAAVADHCRLCQSVAELKGIRLLFSCPESRHVCAFSREDIAQLLFQLLSNALKFTPRGGSVTVELRFAAGQVLLSVSDTGAGIPEERLPTLFDRYLHRNLMDPPPHGLGLGLPLCRRIAEGHGGSIMAETREGGGTCVTLSIPDRTVGLAPLSDVPFDYAGGFNRTLLALADALPAEAFRLREQD